MELRSDLMALCMASLYSIQFILRSQHEEKESQRRELHYIALPFSLRRKQFRLMNEIVIDGKYLLPLRALWMFLLADDLTGS
jgi:hypothetical protein